MSDKVGLADLGPGVKAGPIPSMSIPTVMKTYSAGYDSLTHFVSDPNRYYEYPNAYFMPEVKTSGYYPMKRKCDGDKIYNMNTNL